VRDPRTFEARLRRALIRYADRCPDDIDAAALARELVASSSAGRGPSLPRPNGRVRDLIQTERTSSMTHTLKLAAAVAALAAVGWAVVGVGPQPRSNQADTPGASPSLVVGDDWAFFAGQMEFDGTGRGFTESYIDNGMAVDLGMTGSGHHLVTDDPRINGTRSDITNLFSNQRENSSGNIGTSLFTIENDGGSWTCPMTFIRLSTDKNDAGEIEQWAGWCEGAGGYEGMKAYLALRQPEDAASSSRQDIYGFITSGDGPPMPEAPAS
jgi:hypothetical protein